MRPVHAGALAFALMLLLAGASGCGRDARRPAARTAGLGPCISAPLAVNRDVRVGRGVGAMAVGEGALWVTNAARGTLTRVELNDAGARPRSFSIGAGPVDVAAGFGRVWVADRDGDEVVRFDPRTWRVDRRVGIGVPVATQVTSTGVWILGLDDGQLVRLSPRTGARGFEIDAQVRAPSRIEALGGDIWLLGSNDVVAVNVNAARYTRSGSRLLAASATDLAGGDGALWITDPADHALVRVDPSTGRQSTYAAPDQMSPVAVAVTGCAVVVGDARGRVAAFDARRERWVGTPLSAGRSVGGLVADDQGVWMSDPVAGVARRVVVPLRSPTS